MINMKASHLRMNKAPSLMGVWGIVILLGSIMHQFFGLRPDQVLLMWGLLTLLGIAGQAVCLMRGLEPNFGAWMAVIVVGWFVTLYVIKFDKGYNIEYAGDLPAIWLGLLGLGYVATAFQITRKFWILAAVSFAFGGLLELAARGILQIDFLVEYGPLLFGIFAGVPLIVASLPYFYRPEVKAAPTATAPVSTPS